MILREDQNLYSTLANRLAEFIREDYMRRNFGFSAPDFVGITAGGDFCPIPLSKGGTPILVLYLYSKGVRTANYLKWFLEYHDEGNKTTALALKRPLTEKGRKLLTDLGQKGEALEIRVGSRFTSFSDEGRHILVPLLEQVTVKQKSSSADGTSEPKIDYSGMGYEQLKAEVERIKVGISPSELARKNPRLYKAVLDSKKMPDFEQDRVIVRKQKVKPVTTIDEKLPEVKKETKSEPTTQQIQQPYSEMVTFYSSKTDGELETIVSNGYKGKTVKELKAKDPALYDIIEGRRVLDLVVFKEILRAGKKYATLQTTKKIPKITAKKPRGRLFSESRVANEDLRTIVYVVYHGKYISELVNEDPLLYEELRRRELLEPLISEGWLKRVPFTERSKGISHAKEEKKVPTVKREEPGQVSEYHRLLEAYSALSSEDLGNGLTSSYPDGVDINILKKENEALAVIIKNRGLVGRFRREGRITKQTKTIKQQ